MAKRSRNSQIIRHWKLLLGISSGMIVLDETKLVDIAAVLDTSTKTIYRDVRALHAAGFLLSVNTGAPNLYNYTIAKFIRYFSEAQEEIVTTDSAEHVKKVVTNIKSKSSPSKIDNIDFNQCNACPHIFKLHPSGAIDMRDVYLHKRSHA